MQVVLTNVVLRFSDIFKAKEFTPGDGRPRFSASFLVEKDSENDKKLRAAIEQTAKETWGDKAAQKLKAMDGQKTQFCYTDGDKADYDGASGKMVLAAHRQASQGAPAVVDRAKQPLALESGKPYPGCVVNAVIDIWAQSGENPGIRSGFSAVQFVKDGEPFLGSTPRVDDLPDLSEDLNDDDLV